MILSLIAVLGPLSALYHSGLRGTWTPLYTFIPDAGIESWESRELFVAGIGEAVVGQACFAVVLFVALLVATWPGSPGSRAGTSSAAVAMVSVVVSTLAFFGEALGVVIAILVALKH